MFKLFLDHFLDVVTDVKEFGKRCTTFPRNITSQLSSTEMRFPITQRTAVSNPLNIQLKKKHLSKMSHFHFQLNNKSLQLCRRLTVLVVQLVQVLTTFTLSALSKFDLAISQYSPSLRVNDLRLGHFSLRRKRIDLLVSDFLLLFCYLFILNVCVFVYLMFYHQCLYTVLHGRDGVLTLTWFRALLYIFFTRLSRNFSPHLACSAL